MFELVLLGWVCCGLLSFLLDFKDICGTINEVQEEAGYQQTPGEERLSMFFLVCVYLFKGPFTLFQSLEMRYYGVHNKDE